MAGEDDMFKGVRKGLTEMMTVRERPAAGGSAPREYPGESYPGREKGECEP